MILQAAATGNFNFHAIGPRYYTRLNLVVGEMRRLNQAKAAEQSALHCIISTVMADKDSRETNYERAQHNRRIMLEMLHIPQQETDNKSLYDRLINEWEQVYGKKARTKPDSTETVSPGESGA